MATIEQGVVIAERYRLEQELGRGGMGAIWQGQDQRLDSPVAVKLMHPELIEKPALRARFEREAKAAARIRSQHVVHVYDHGVHDDAPFMVMELLEGEDLGERLRREGVMAVEEADRISNQICHGLHRAHELGVVHRDLKPSNVFLSAPDRDAVKLLDFGIAKATGIRPVGSETTKSGELLGSPHYMAPEQVRGAELDARTDLWALAVILYRLLTGERPFEGDDVGDLIVRIATESPAAPSAHRGELDGAFDHFFAKAFRRDVDDRFQSARLFAEAFSAAARGETTWPTGSEIGSGGSWDTTRAAARSSVTTRQLGGALAPPLEPTPVDASRTLPGDGAKARARRWWMAAAAGLVVLGVLVALVVSDGDPAATAPGGEGGAAAATSSAIEDTATHSETATASADPEQTTSASEAQGGDGAAPSTTARPRPTGRLPRPAPTSSPRAPATAAPPPRTSKPGVLDDLGVGGMRLGYD